MDAGANVAASDVIMSRDKPCARRGEEAKWMMTCHCADACALMCRLATTLRAAALCAPVHPFLTSAQQQ